MRSTAALIWKEWREMLWFAIFGLLIFNGFPLFEATIHWESNARFYSDSGEGIVLGLGGLFTIIVAVAVTCRDLDGGVKTFWLSRPIPATRFLAVKYVTGLTVLLIATVPTLLAQMAMWRGSLPYYADFITSDSFTRLVLLCHTPTLALVFSTSFLIGVAVRKAVPAALLSIAAALLVYFLPVLVPPLGFASVINMMAASNTPHRLEMPTSYVGFLLITLASCGLAALASILVLRRDWRLRADLRLLCWTLGGVVLLLLVTGAWQIGSNLVGERRIALSMDRSTTTPFHLVVQGERGILASWNIRPHSNAELKPSLTQFDLSEPNGGFGNPVDLAGGFGTMPTIVSASRPDRVYAAFYEGGHVRTEAPSLWDGKRPSLLTLAIGQPGGPTVLNRLDLSKEGYPNAIAECMAVLGDKLYIQARDYQVPNQSTKSQGRLITVDISNPDAPVVERSVDLARAGFLTRVVVIHPGERIPNTCDLALIPVPGLSPRDRLELSLQLAIPYWTPTAFEGELLVNADKLGLTTYRLTGTANDIAHFTEIGSLRKSPLLRLVASPLRLVLRNGRACVMEQGLAQVISIYDVSRPERPRRIAHYAAPQNLFGLAFLGDGRLLVAGDELTILRVP